MSEEQDVLLNALATDTKLTRQQARDTRYDVCVLQEAMDAAKPFLKKLGGYRPLLVWLRESYRGGTVSSEQDLKPYKNVRKVFHAYVKINGPDDARHASKDVRVYVGEHGQYLVCIVKPLEGREQDQFNDSYTARVIICENAENIAEVLHQMHLQHDRYKDYDPFYEIKSPLTELSQGIVGTLTTWMREVAAEQANAQQAHARITVALSKVG